MTSMITARVDSDKRKKAEKVFSEVGLTTSGAVNLFICAVAMSGGIPFPVGIPAQRYMKIVPSGPGGASSSQGLKIGLADGKYAFPDGFDEAFDAMDGEIADMFK